MKKIIAIALALLTAAAFTACSGGNNGNNESKSDKGSAAESTTVAETTVEMTEAESTVPQSTSNTTYNVGEFTVFVPEGWEAIPVPDHLDETKTATNDIMLAKGAVFNENTMTWNTEEAASFYVTYLGSEDFAKIPDEKADYAKDFSIDEMEDTKIGDHTWHGFSVNPIGAPVYTLWTESGEGGYHISLSTAYGLSLEDKDVQAIIASLK